MSSNELNGGSRGSRTWSWCVRHRRFWERGLALIIALIVVRLAPNMWCGSEAGAWYRGDAAVQHRLLKDVRRYTDAGLGEEAFSTGSSKFNGEWIFGTYFMAGMGYAQVATEHTRHRPEAINALRTCISRLISRDVQKFDANDWGVFALKSLDGNRGHAAYLGYLNLLLGLDRRLDPKTPNAGLHDRISATLARRLAHSKLLLIETYPDEVYPVDNTAVVASIALHQVATGTNHSELLTRWETRFRKHYIHQPTGLLIQRVDSDTGEPVDAPRGSGTALASYFLSFSNAKLSQQLFAALRRHLAGGLLGFGAIREVPMGTPEKKDIDSGPIIAGYGLSATGFAIAPARIHRDPALFRRLVATATLFGAPRSGDRAGFITGGPLGNSILFAMLTAQPTERWIAAPKASPRGAP